MIELVYIPEDMVDGSWKHVEKDVADALARSNGYALASNIKQWVKDKKMQLWILWDKDKPTTKEKYYGVVVTEIVKRKLKKSCNIFIVTGRQRRLWTPLIQVIEDFAKEQDCDQMELIARPGWDKIMKPFNYKRTHVVLEKQIEKGE